MNWNGKEVACARSKGGVLALIHPLENLISNECFPWPTPEVVQKLYRSRHALAFAAGQFETCASGIGYYCDLQSIHSEDAITWSVFGTAARAPQVMLAAWLANLFALLRLPAARTEHAGVFLWRRIPHPDTLTMGGPEIDVGIITSNAVVLCEAKWKSRVGTGQGKERNKDQIQLRGEFLAKYGRAFFPTREHLVVLGINLAADSFVSTSPRGIEFRSTTWEDICSLRSHPLADEVKRYFEWKRTHS